MKAGLNKSAEVASPAKEARRFGTPTVSWSRRSCVTSAGSLPYAGKGVVRRIITDLAVIDIEPDGLHPVELAPGVTEEEVGKTTEPPLLCPQSFLWQRLPPLLSL